MIHPTAEVESGATIGSNAQIWHFTHVRAGAIIGSNCILGHSVYIDSGVVVGENVKLQNRVSVYRGVTIEDGVFVGPHATFTNDKYPRAITPEGSLATDSDWTASTTLVKHGASIGAGAIILPGVTIGRWAMVAAGAVVSRDIPDHGLATGVPAVPVGYVCHCGKPMREESTHWTCDSCSKTFDLPAGSNSSR